MLNLLSRCVLSLQARLYEMRFSLPVTSIFSSTSQSESAEEPLTHTTPLDVDSDTASYSFVSLLKARTPSTSTTEINYSCLSTHKFEAQHGSGPKQSDIPIGKCCSSSGDISNALPSGELPSMVTVTLPLEIVGTLQEVLIGRREAKRRAARRLDATVRTNCISQILLDEQQKKDELSAELDALTKSQQQNYQDIDATRQDAIMASLAKIQTTFEEMEHDKRVADRKLAKLDQEQLLEEPWQNLLQDSIFSALADSLVQQNLLSPKDLSADEISDDGDKSSTTASSSSNYPLSTAPSSEIVTPSLLAQRIDNERKETLKVAWYDAKENHAYLQQTFNGRAEQEEYEKGMLRKARGTEKAWSMTSSQFDVDFLRNSMRLTTDLVAAEKRLGDIEQELAELGILVEDEVVFGDEEPGEGDEDGDGEFNPELERWLVDVEGLAEVEDDEDQDRGWWVVKGRQQEGCGEETSVRPIGGDNSACSIDGHEKTSTSPIGTGREHGNDDEDGDDWRGISRRGDDDDDDGGTPLIATGTQRRLIDGWNKHCRRLRREGGWPVGVDSKHSIG